MKDTLGKPAHELAMRTDSQAYSRTNDPAESVQAAETVDVNRGQRIVLKALYEAFTHAGEDGERGVTDGQVYDYLSRVGLILSPSGARTRRHELCEAGLAFKASVVKDYVTHRTYGRYTLTPQGVALAGSFSKQGWNL